MNKGEQPAADAQQYSLGLSEERGAVRRDASEKACEKMRKGGMKLKGCDEAQWCGGGDYWNGHIFGKCFATKGKTTHGAIRAGGERQRVGNEALNTLRDDTRTEIFFF